MKDNKINLTGILINIIELFTRTYNIPFSKNQIKKKELLEILHERAEPYSRINNGAKLTVKRARKWSAGIVNYFNIDQSAVKGISESIISEVNQNLTESHIFSDIHSLEEVTKLFDRLSNPNSLLCVEYRGWPRASRLAKHPEYAEVAGKAIASGLKFALFQPFYTRDIQTGKDKHPPFMPTDAKAYMDMLNNKVRGVYREMLEAALKNYDKNSGISREQIQNNIVLYERNQQTHIGSGFGSRMFLACTKRAEAGEILKEPWEWVAADHKYSDDVFTRIDTDNLPGNALFESFAPVTHYWVINNDIPVNKKQLEEADKLLKEHDCEYTAQNIWNIYTANENR